MREHNRPSDTIRVVSVDKTFGQPEVVLFSRKLSAIGHGDAERYDVDGRMCLMLIDLDGTQEDK
jgi:hypothetical protein